MPTKIWKSIDCGSNRQPLLCIQRFCELCVPQFCSRYRLCLVLEANGIFFSNDVNYKKCTQCILTFGILHLHISTKYAVIHQSVEWWQSFSLIAGYWFFHLVGEHIPFGCKWKRFIDANEVIMSISIRWMRSVPLNVWWQRQTCDIVGIFSGLRNKPLN